MGKSTLLLSLMLLLVFPVFLFSAQIEATDIEYTLYKGKRLEWTFKARYFSKERGDLFFGKDVVITNPYKGLKIKGNQAFYYQREDKFVIKGRVRLFTRNRGELFTSELVFFPGRNLVVGDREVILKQKDLVMRGRGFIYRLDRQELKLKGKTRAIFSM